ncbi:hypothetical protein FGG08_003164 [Glutinoglossum americanum]|uniref:Protein transport protein sec16 n=1 Tax=Glutinoglossum americanum TaxID=1670608 RepID=A0A9P8I335_9PEZI|nr:hypothetical protein FGG08_003164 [Glutinoglossum americanum]
MTSNIPTMASERDSPRREETAETGHPPSTVFTAAALPEFIGSRSMSPVQYDASTSSNRVDSHPSSPQQSNPSQGLGHSSSGSFARTVSHEITWAQDEFIDPAWGLRRKESDPFAFMSGSDRTNSFPEVPPAHHAVSSPNSHVSSHSVMGETVEGMGKNGIHRSSSFPEIRPEINMEENPTHFTTEEPDDGLNFFDNFGKSQGGSVSTPPDYEARYEEGVPLVHPLGHHDNGDSSESLRQPEPSDPFGGSSESDNDSFFNNAPTDPQDQESFSPLVNRKSTSPVLASLNFASEKESRGGRQPDVSGGGIDVSMGLLSAYTPENARIASGASEDGAVYEPMAKSVDKTEHGTSDLDEQAGNNDELTARWEAVLDDDELLDDDEPTLGPSRFFEDDEDGFLEDEAPVAFSGGTAGEVGPHPYELAISGATTSHGFYGVGTGGIQPGGFEQDSIDRRAPTDASRQQQSQSLPNPYVPAGQQPSSQGSPQNIPLHTKPSPYGHSNFTSSFSQPQQQSQLLAQQSHELPQSFSDKSKGGYSSPYDLPVDIRPRKRTSMQQIPTNVVGRGPAQQPPPRSSSMYVSQPSDVIPRPVVPLPTASAPRPSPPIPSRSFQPPTGSQPTINASATVPLAVTGSKSNSFFEELPITSKPRQSSSHGRYTPQPSGTPPLHHSQQDYGQPPQAPLSVPHAPLPAQQLLPPERVSPFAATPHATHTLPPPAVPTARYSPVPPPRSSNFQGQGKYAAQPASAPPAPTTSLPHQPRIGSPLAHYEVQHQGQPPSKGAAPPTSTSQKQQQETHGRPSSQGVTARSVSNLGGAPREEEEMVFERKQIQQENLEGKSQQHPYWPAAGASLPGRTSATPPPPKILPGQITQSPSKRATSNYAPQYQPSAPAAEPSFAPPRRAQTQSPGTSIAGPKLSTMPQDPYQRPSSAHGTVSPPTFAGPYATVSERVPADQTRQFAPSLSYITPTDGREVDPLQRWKGCPIFVWGFGGTIVTSFPKEVPRYSSGHAQPLMVCSPGEVKIKSAKDVLPLEDKFAKFPGPLRAKGKKKEVLGWLTENIESQEREAGGLGYGPITTEARKRYEEKLLLWKILRVLVEKDGVLEGNTEVEEAVRTILLPGAEVDREDSHSQYGGALASVARSVNVQLQPDSVDPLTFGTLRKILLEGDREKAVWYAVDRRLWGHAMLISSTLNRDTWKQVVQEFVRQEIKNLGSNTEPLAALYEIFAGNVEESIDELVPPSARAGLQMVSTSADTGPTKNALEGLDRWKETLSLVLSNRSADDEQALVSIGKLLAGYGRVEAAHLCYLFVRSYPAFGGADDPQTSFALLGADHTHQPVDFAGNLESVLLSEIYEFAATLTSSGHGSPAPHLQAYKLYHALVLADYGYRNEAQGYCAAITNSIRSTTKSSPYYHSGLFSTLDDLSNRLQQSPKDSSGSWISKPSMEKVSGSMWAKFNSFVAGDESDAASTGSGKDGLPEIGPFSKIAGGTPSLSRTSSAVDLYGAAYISRDPVPPLAVPNSSFESSRYAPKKSYEPQGLSSYDMQRTTSQEPRTSMESQSGSYDAKRPADTVHGAHELLQNDTFEPTKLQSFYQPVSRPAQHENATQQTPLYSSLSVPPAQNPYAMMTSDATTSSPYYPNASQRPGPPSDSSHSYQGYEPQQPHGPHAPSSAEIEESSGYDQPSYSGYEPPTSSTPYNEAESGGTSPIEDKPKKRSIYDDDDDGDLTARAAEIARREEKEKGSKEKTATPNGKQETYGEKKPGWFSGWFGKKDPNSPAGPIKAKLGEESSFYYDPEQKRWVNKKAGATTPAPAATPPPPRGPTPRSSSGPPSVASASKPTPPAPVSTDTLAPSLTASAPPISLNGLYPPQSAPPPSRSPSIPGTPPRTDSPLSGGLAPPTLFGGSAGPASGPPSRPSTALSNASSIDDLIGPPGTARKGGTIKKNKAKRGYVDVMAK